MKLIEKNITQTIEEIYLVETLNLNDKTILEIGCGAADMTKKIANNGFNRKIIACDIDEVQHEKNLKLNIENIEFRLCTAENIDVEDNSIDFIFMFKSFHHIPKKSMNEAIKEIKRVLKPNSLAYICEPLYYGELNELISIFHDEEEVRINAYETIKNAVENEELKLFREIFFQSEVNYKDFNDFQKRQMNHSYNENNHSDELIKKVKEKFDSYGGGETSFLKPLRVDILQKI